MWEGSARKLGELNRWKRFLKKIRCTDKVDGRVWEEGEKSEQTPPPTPSLAAGAGRGHPWRREAQTPKGSGVEGTMHTYGDPGTSRGAAT